MPERVRPEAQRHAGAMGVAAANGEPIGVAVVSETEVERWRHMAYEKEKQAAQAEHTAATRDERKALSVARANGWTGTIDGQLRAKQEAHQRRALEAEARRQKIDEEEATLQRELKERQRDDAYVKMNMRDPRIVAMNSQLMLQAVINEREDQIVLSARKKEFAQEREREFHIQAIENAKRVEEQERSKALTARERAKEARQACLDQINEQKAVRAEAKERARLEGQMLRLAADEEVYQERKALEQRVAKAKELNFHRVKQWSEADALQSPRASNRQRLDAAKQSNQWSDGEQADYVYKKATQLAAWQSRNERAYQRREEKQGLALETWNAALQNSPRTLNESRMPDGPSISDRFHHGDDTRIAGRKEAKQRYIAALEKGKDKMTSQLQDASQQRETMNAEIRRRMAEQQDEERQAAIDRRADEKRFRRILELQTREKKSLIAQEKDVEKREYEAALRALDEEEAVMASYLEQQTANLPLSPVIRKKALKPVAPTGTSGISPRRNLGAEARPYHTEY